MKKNLFIFAAAFAAILSSCAKQELVNPAEDQTEFKAFIEDGAKTVLGDKNGNTYPLTWSAGDRICVNGIMSEELSAGSGTKNASFKVSGLGSASSYNITYPGKAGSDNIAAFPMTVSLTSPVLPMYASSSSRSFAMNHLAGVLRLSFTSESSLKINSIELTTPGGEALGGEMTIGKTGTVLNGTLSGGQNTITVDCGSGISLSSTATGIMIPVPAGTYSKGITITLTDNNQESMVVGALNNNGVVVGGQVLEFDTEAYVPDSSGGELYLINNTETLKAFISSVNGGDDAAKIKGAKVTADFTVSSSDAAALAEVTEYYGVFDGNNKTITGLKKPLFSTLYGQIKNLTLNSTIEVTDDDTYSTGMFVRELAVSQLADEPGALYNCVAKGTITWNAPSAETQDHAVGGLVGRSIDGIIVNCENQAIVTTAGETGKQLVLGGVMGRGQKSSDGSTVSGCTNSGVVNCNGTSSNVYIGGVVGYDVNGECSTSNCSNTGTVQIGEDGFGNPVNLGGVIGLAAGAIDDLSNSGTVQTLWSGSNGPHCYIGGVAGRVSTTSKTLTNLKHLSEGKVIVSGKGYTMEIGGVVGWMRGGKAQGWDCAGKVTLDGGAYTVLMGGLVGCAGNRKYAKTEGGDGSKHMTFTDCVTSSTGLISTTDNALITSSTNANDNALAVGGMFGRVDEGVTVNGSSVSAATVSIVPVKKTTHNQHYFIGGIAGYVSVLNNAASTTGVEFNGVQNNGAVMMTKGSNSMFGGTYIGGIIGYSTFFKAVPVVLINCVNNGAVTNDGGNVGEQDVIIGGICGKIVANQGVPFTLKGCKNYGPITNSGTSTWKYSSAISASWGVITAGVVGRVEGECILSATSTTDANRNINYGTVTDNSDSKAPCLSGVVGAIAGTGSEFEYCENRGTVQYTGPSCYGAIVGGVAGHINSISDIDYTSNFGDVKVLGNPDSKTTGKFFMMGGIMAMIQDVSSHDFSISHATNEGDVTLSNVDLNVTGAQLFIGGCVGEIGWDGAQNFNYLTNKGDVIVSAVDNSAPTTAFNYVAGIMAANYDDKLLDHCTNSGAIECGNNSGSGNPYRLDLKARVGGIAAYLTVAPTNCTNTGSVTCVKKYNSKNNDKSNVGGIAGYLGGSNVALENLVSTGNVSTAGASPLTHIGGLIGYTASVTSVTNCTVGGYINGGSTTNGGFFFSHGGTTSDLVFSGCHLKKGAKITHKYGGTSVTKTYSTVGASLSVSDYFVIQKNDYTVTNCTVID